MEKYTSKRCSKCKQHYPATLEYFYAWRESKDGFYPHCKECKRSSSAEYRRLYPDKEHAKGKKWRQANKDKVKEGTRRWQKANPEKVKEAWQKYSKAHRSELLDKAKAYRETHREEVRLRTRLQRIKHPDTSRKAEKTRAARKRALPATLTVQEWEDIKATYGYSCAYCGMGWFELSSVLEQEHVIPVCQGGGYTKDNIVPACRQCNLKKQGKTPEEAGMPIKKPHD